MLFETEETDNSHSQTTSIKDKDIKDRDRGTLFVPFLGQSNANHMSIVYEPYQPGSTDNDISGAIALDRELTDLSDRDIITSDTRETNFAIGGSKVNGNGYFQDDSTVWWYPDFNQPGGALRQAQQGLDNWLAEQGAESDDEIAIVWSQGESDVGDVSYGDPASREKYKQSTQAVFDSLDSNLDYANVTFYIVPTGRVQREAAANVGLDSGAVDLMNQGVEIVNEVQAEIALERDDVQLVSGYADLNMIYEEGQIYGESYDQEYYEWSGDFWHLGHDGLKVNGDRLAQYIALDRGESNVLSFTDSFGNPAESVALSRDGLLDLNISAKASSDLIQGSNLPDVIVGTLAADKITGGNGNDVIISGKGVDTLTGGAGKDIFFYDDLADLKLADNSDRILDFQLGSDRLDLSELLIQSDYTGKDPIADGYVKIVSGDRGTIKIRFDADGTGRETANTVAILEDIDPIAFQDDSADQLIVTPTEF